MSMSEPRIPDYLTPALMVLVVLLGFLPVRALADQVHLTNGRVMSGEVIEEDDKYIVLKVPYGQVKLRREQIEFIERESKLDYQLQTGRTFLNQRRFIPALTQLEQAVTAHRDSKEARKALADGYGVYAEHLVKARRLGEARKYFRRVLKLDPTSKKTRSALASLQKDSGVLADLIRKGRVALAAGDLRGAIDQFQKVLAFDSDAGAQIGADFGLCHARMGHAQYKARQFEEATRNLKRAFELNPALADQMESLFVASALSQVLEVFASGDGPKAKSLVDEVLALTPTNAQALYIAGRVYEKEKKTSDAVKLYARGLDTRVTRSDAQQMAELRRKLEASLGLPEGGTKIRFSVANHDTTSYAQVKAGDFEVLETEHFQVYHRNDELGREVGKVLEAHRLRIADIVDLRTGWKEKAKVFLHRTQEEYTSATAQPGWTGGVSKFMHVSGKGLTKMQVHTWQTSPRLFKSVLPHEVAHLVVNQKLQTYGQLPRALQEGFAVLMEPGFRHSYFLRFLRSRLKSTDFIPLGELLVMEDYPRDQEFFYAEGFALVYYLVKTQGMDQALRLINESGSKNVSKAILLRLTGMRSMEEIEKDWRDWLRKQ